MSKSLMGAGLAALVIAASWLALPPAAEAG
jgi:hypothetical protein